MAAGSIGNIMTKSNCSGNGTGNVGGGGGKSLEMKKLNLQDATAGTRQQR